VNWSCHAYEFAMNSAPTFYLRLFGSPSIEGPDGAPLAGRVSQRHRVALLALLALTPDSRLTRDKLIAYLWPESDQERGRNLLSVATYVLRSSLGEAAVVAAGEDLRLNREVIRTDVAEFEEAIERGDHARAAALYRGPLLDGFFLSDAPEFDQWASRERDRLAAGYRKALEALAEAAERAANFSGAADFWRLRSAQDPYDSRVAARLMQALDRGGNKAAALQHASIHQRLLQQEFGIALPPDVAALVERLKREPVAVPLAAPPSAPPPLVPPRPPPSGPAMAARTWIAWAGFAAVAAIVLLVAVQREAAIARVDRSIAVLPFSDLSPGGSGNTEYFSDGLTEEIITGLSAVPELRVISRTSSMHFKGSEKSVRQIAQELKVAHILEGSVRQSGGRVRITAQLIDAESDEHIWAETFDEDLRDVLRVQEQLARKVVQALRVELGDRGQRFLVRQGTTDTVAYELYRRARYLWNTRTREGHDRAIEYFRRAIERDSSYADAYAGMSDAYLTAYNVNVSSLPDAEVYSRAKWAAERALALDDKSADAHTSFAACLLWQRNWPGAEREFRRAIELNPSHATARAWYALLLSGLGRSRESFEESRRAFELDPFAVVPSSNHGWHCYLMRDMNCAIEQARRTLEIAPSNARTYERLALAYAQKGMLDDALRAIRKAIEISPERTDYGADLAYVQALRGETAAAHQTLARAKIGPFEPFNIARAYVALRQPDSAFAWLERSSWQWPHRADRRDPALDGVRNDARFVRLSARIERDMGVR
jgi:TolB-like protein/DNA-binding SARP family transcriptional activator